MWLCASIIQITQPCPVGIYKGRFTILWVYKDKSRHGKTVQWLSIPPSIKAKVHATVFKACMICPPLAPRTHMHRPGRSFPSLFTWPCPSPLLQTGPAPGPPLWPPSPGTLPSDVHVAHSPTSFRLSLSCPT